MGYYLMNILILTCCFGMGHYSAAQAVKEDLMKCDSNISVTIVDIIEWLFPMTNKVIYTFFNSFICKFSGIYNFINKIASKNSSKPLTKGKMKGIRKLMDKFKPDIIVSTWSGSTKYAAKYKKGSKDDTPLYTYITDIEAHEGWYLDESDLYFVGTESTKEKLIENNIDYNKIVISGIPIRQAFKDDNNYDKKNEKKEILLMGGGLGLIPCIWDILTPLSNDNRYSVTVITGKNKRMYKKIKNKFPDINVISYTKEVDKYMKNADIIVTKPGGISIFEAIYTDTPLFIINPTLSQEVINGKFIEENCIGKVVWNVDSNIDDMIVSVIEDDKLISEMKENMQLIKNDIEEARLRLIYKEKKIKCG